MRIVIGRAYWRWVVGFEVKSEDIVDFLFGVVVKRIWNLIRKS